jgi:hypothetical protein
MDTQALVLLVAKGGIEPPTHGFSGGFSLPKHVLNQQLATLANT